MIQALTPQTAFLLAAALVGVAAVVLLFVRSPLIGISALAGGQALQVVLRGHVPGLYAGINLYPLDLLTVCAALAALVSLVRDPRRPHLGHAALVLLGLLVAVNLVIGMAAYGVQPAGNEARVYFLHVLGAAGYVATVRCAVPLDRVVLRVWTVLACVYGITAVYWWSRIGIGNNSTQVLIDGVLVDSRPVDSDAAFLIAEAAVMILCYPRRTRGSRVLAALLLLLVVLLQHRTVWLAAAVMLTGWLLFRSGRAVSKAAGVGAAILLAVMALVTASLFRNAGLTQNLASSASNEDTMKWRLDSWSQLFGQLSGIQHWLFGLPFGSKFTRYIHGVLVETQPHDYYLHLILRVGVVGLCAAVVLVLAMLRRTDHRSSAGLFLWLSMAGIACYCLTYAVPFEQSLLIGLLLRQPLTSRAAHRATQTAPSLRPVMATP